MKILIARCISILGHPLLLIPAAAVGVSVSRHANKATMHSLIFLLVVVVVAVLAFSIWRVRSGRWMHVDASKPSERSSLNWFLMVGLLLLSALTWYYNLAHEIAVGFLVCAMVVVVAIVLSPILKISLHTGFAVIAAGFFWPNQMVVVVGLLVMVVLAWSRLVLGRHTFKEVIIGGIAGGTGTIAYHALVAYLLI